MKAGDGDDNAGGHSVWGWSRRKSSLRDSGRVLQGKERVTGCALSGSMARLCYGSWMISSTSCLVKMPSRSSNSTRAEVSHYGGEGQRLEGHEVVRGEWCARQDLNLRPAGSKPTNPCCQYPFLPCNSNRSRCSGHLPFGLSWCHSGPVHGQNTDNGSRSPFVRQGTATADHALAPWVINPLCFPNPLRDQSHSLPVRLLSVSWG